MSYNTEKNRNRHRRYSLKKRVLESFAKSTGKYLCWSLFFNKAAGLRPAILLKRETLTQMFSCEFWKIFKNTVFHITLPVPASEIKNLFNLRAGGLVKLLQREMYEYLDYLLEANLSRKSMVTRSAKTVAVNYNLSCTK